MSAILTDGFPTQFGFVDLDPVMGIILYEKSLKAFGIDGGGPNDTTTMRTLRWRTRQSKKLVTLTEMTMTCAYDPACFTELVDVVQLNSLLALYWPDGSGVEFWGWIDSFNPNDVAEGAQPEAEVTVCPSNQDNDFQEVAPVYDPTYWVPDAPRAQYYDL